MDQNQAPYQGFQRCSIQHLLDTCQNSHHVWNLNTMDTPVKGAYQRLEREWHQTSSPTHIGPHIPDQNRPNEGFPSNSYRWLKWGFPWLRKWWHQTPHNPMQPSQHISVHNRINTIIKKQQPEGLSHTDTPTYLQLCQQTWYPIQHFQVSIRPHSLFHRPQT